MAFASQYELIATIIKQDRYVVEIDEHGVGELLTSILRTCHDYADSPKWDADDVGNHIANLILGWASGEGIVLWPEEQGEGPVDWESVDAADAAQQKVTREAQWATAGVPIPIPTPSDLTLDIEGGQ